MVIHLITCILKVLTIVWLWILILIPIKLFVVLCIPIDILVIVYIIFVFLCMIFIFTAISIDIIARSWILFKPTFSAWSCSFRFCCRWYLIFLCGGLSKIIGVFRHYTLILFLRNFVKIFCIKDGSITFIFSRHHFNIIIKLWLILDIFVSQFLHSMWGINCLLGVIL